MLGFRCRCLIHLLRRDDLGCHWCLWLLLGLLKLLIVLLVALLLYVIGLLKHLVLLLQQPPGGLLQLLLVFLGLTLWSGGPLLSWLLGPHV